MATLIIDPEFEERLRAERKAIGADGYDEVWEGLYVMTPHPGEEHQAIQMRLAVALQAVIGWESDHRIYAGINVSDRDNGWEHNYRVPDVAVFLAGTQARNCGTHWRGGPDFAVEIISPGDRSREKLAFYAEVGVRELLLIARDPWGLERYQLEQQQLALKEMTSLEVSRSLASSVLPVQFRLIEGPGRPLIEVARTDQDEHWKV